MEKPQYIDWIVEETGIVTVPIGKIVEDIYGMIV